MIAYFNVIAKDCERLQRLQNSALRIILRANRRTGVSMMHKELGMHTLENRRHKHTCHEAYKCFSGMSPAAVVNMFQRVAETHEVNTRSAVTDQIVIPNVRLQCARRDFAYRGPFYRQMLDSNIRTADSLGQFKGRLNRSDLFS